MTKTPHDALFKSVFQQPENAAAELQHVLSAEHVSAINWSTLKLEPGSYVDEKLADQHSDLLFSVPTTLDFAREVESGANQPTFAALRTISRFTPLRPKLRCARHCATIDMSWKDTLSLLDIIPIIGERRSGGQGGLGGPNCGLERSPETAGVQVWTVVSALAFVSKTPQRRALQERVSASRERCLSSVVCRLSSVVCRTKSENALRNAL